MENSISLNKFISDTGYCSRREADNLITEGRVFLNDKPAVLGNRYKPGDTVEVDGSLITAAKKEKRVYLALNKPVGITTTTELHVKDNIITFVGYQKRIFPIGRLDKESEGLILLTNDGDIINKILRADNNHEKEYIVRVNKPIDGSFIHQLSNGVPVLDTVTLPCKVQPMGRQTFRITLTQGLNRQIRRMCEHLGYAVVGLQRVRIMNIKLDKLAVGKWRYLSDAELSILMENIADSSKEKSPAKPKSAARSNKGGNYIPPPHKREFSSKDREKTGKDKSTKPATKDGKMPPPHKREFSSKDKVHTTKDKGAKPVTKDGKPQAAGKKPVKPFYKEDKVAKKSAQSRPDKQGRPEKNKHAGKEKKEHEHKKQRPAEGSFKSYRSKGRR